MILDPDDDLNTEIEDRLRRIIAESYEIGFVDGKIVGDVADISNLRKWNSGKEFANIMIKAFNDS
jgi:hypothetical protein